MINGRGMTSFLASGVSAVIYMKPYETLRRWKSNVKTYIYIQNFFSGEIQKVHQGMSNGDMQKEEKKKKHPEEINMKM